MKWLIGGIVAACGLLLAAATIVDVMITIELETSVE